jgi:hypothetical protein
LRMKKPEGPAKVAGPFLFGGMAKWLLLWAFEGGGRFERALIMGDIGGPVRHPVREGCPVREQEIWRRAGLF